MSGDRPVRLAAQVGAHLLEKPHGASWRADRCCTRGASRPVVGARVATVAGMRPRLAAAMDAEVLLLDHSPQRLRTLESDTAWQRMIGLGAAVP